MTKEQIIASLTPLFERARLEGLWFYSSYQDLWFSPDELQKAQAEGRFVWGEVNWTLRHPSERREQLQREADAANNRLREFDKKRQA